MISHDWQEKWLAMAVVYSVNANSLNLDPLLAIRYSHHNTIPKWCSYQRANLKITTKIIKARKCHVMWRLKHKIRIWDRSERGICSLEQRERIGSTSVSLQSVSVCNLTEAQQPAPTIDITSSSVWLFTVPVTCACAMGTQHTSRDRHKQQIIHFSFLQLSYYPTKFELIQKPTFGCFSECSIVHTFW